MWDLFLLYGRVFSKIMVHLGEPQAKLHGINPGESELLGFYFVEKIQDLSRRSVHAGSLPNLWKSIQ